MCMYGAPDVCYVYVFRGIWYADDAGHMFLVGVIELVVVSMCSACANCKLEGIYAHTYAHAAKGYLDRLLELGLGLGLEAVFVFVSKSENRDRAVEAVASVSEARAV